MVPVESPPSIAAVPCPDCPVCGEPGKALYEGLQDRLFSAPGEWSLSRCGNHDCGLIWLDPMPEPRDIGKAYLDYYTHGIGDPRKSGLQRWIDGVVEGYLHHRYGYDCPGSSAANFFWWLLYGLPGKRIDADFSVFWQSSKPGGRLLEVGCGSGAMLAQLKRRGWRVHGLDLDPSAVDAAKSRGLRVDLGHLSEQAYPHASFDVVVMSHVIEHVHDPRALLAEVRRVLAEGGQLVLLTPNNQSLWHRCFKASWMSLDPPRHLHIFNVATMQRLIREVGYQQSTVSTIIRDANGGFLGSCHIRQSGRHDMSQIPPFGARLLGRVMQWVEWGLHVLKPHCGEDLLVIARAQTSGQPLGGNLGQTRVF